MLPRRLAALSLAFLAACNGPQVAPPTDSADTESTDSPATTAPTTGADTETGDACDGAASCYDCEPNEPVQVLNHCTDAACQPFANTSERLPLLKSDGTLPPVP